MAVYITIYYAADRNLYLYVELKPQSSNTTQQSTRVCILERG